MIEFGRKWLVITAIAVFLTVSPASAQQGRFANVEIKSTDLGNGIYMLTGAGGNIGLSTGKDGAFLVDDQFAPLSDKIKAAIAEHSKTPVRFLINTHWHGDHTGGNINFGVDGAIIVAHKNVRKRMSTEEFIEAFNSKVKPAPDIALPIITFTREISFYQNEQTINVIHVSNAHTDGDAFVYFKEADVLHLGDLFFNGIYPFIDTRSGGGIDGVIAGLQQALDLSTENTKIIPGHGALANKQDLQENILMLKQVRRIIGTLVEQGLDADQSVAADPLAALNEDWGKGFIKPERMVRIVHGDLSKTKMDKADHTAH
jgi:glyoxylase-like metal-dependent hydrolase (beta-lactamase superfamily II)